MMGKVIGVITFLLLFGLGMFVIFADVDDEVKVVKCYDRYNNEILGEKCIDRPNGDEQAFKIVIGSFAILGGLMIGGMMWIQDSIWDSY